MYPTQMRRHKITRILLILFIVNQLVNFVIGVPVAAQENLERRVNAPPPPPPPPPPPMPPKPLGRPLPFPLRPYAWRPRPRPRPARPPTISLPILPEERPKPASSFPVTTDKPSTTIPQQISGPDLDVRPPPNPESQPLPNPEQPPPKLEPHPLLNPEERPSNPEHPSATAESPVNKLSDVLKISKLKRTFPVPTPVQ